MAPAAPEDDIGGARGRGTLLVPAAGVLGNQRSPAVLGWGQGIGHNQLHHYCHAQIFFTTSRTRLTPLFSDGELSNFSPTVRVLQRVH
jgi:hypothetical protein